MAIFKPNNLIHQGFNYMQLRLKCGFGTTSNALVLLDKSFIVEI